MRREIPEKNIARCENEKYITRSSKDSPKSLFQKGLIPLGSLYGRKKAAPERQAWAKSKIKLKKKKGRKAKTCG